MILDIIKIIILSIVEALTEFIPVSSTGHMIIVEEFLKLSNNKSFVNAFEIIIQLGAIFAVILIFFKKLFPYIYKSQKRKELLILWQKILIAFIPSAILGFLLDDIITKYFFNYITVSITLLIYGIILIYIEKIKKNSNINDLRDITYTKAFIIGIFQSLAMIPGTSRSAATIIGSMLLGLNRIIATEFSFFLAIPTMFGASIYKIFKIGNILSRYEILLIFLGFILTFFFSLLIINKFLEYIKKNDFKIFGYYRIILAIIILSYYYIKG